MKVNSERTFATVKLKIKTANRFRAYSRNIAISHTAAMEMILDFFESSRISPADDLGPNMKTLEGNLKKRINAVVAILRDIEKTQTKPMMAMLQLLFQEAPSAKKELLVEKKKMSEKQDDINLSLEHELKKENSVLKKKLRNNSNDIRQILDSVIITRSSFGKVQLRLQMDRKDFERIKTKLLEQCT